MVDTLLWKERGQYFRAYYFPLKYSLVIFKFDIKQDAFNRLYTKYNVSHIEWNEFMKRVLHAGKGTKPKL